jgi:hypothetical protein
MRTRRADQPKARHAQLSLWDRLSAIIATPRAHRKPIGAHRLAAGRPQNPAATRRIGPAPLPDPTPASAPLTPMRRIYRDMAHDLPARYGVTVTRWRSSNSGVAILRKLNDGRWLREMEAPYPKGPVSAAVFCHEIGHHALGVGSITPRCREEHAAWMWALDELRNRDITITNAVHNRVYDALHHAVHTALRRGLKRIPPELTPYLEPRPRPRHAARRAG